MQLGTTHNAGARSAPLHIIFLLLVLAVIPTKSFQKIKTVMEHVPMAPTEQLSKHISSAFTDLFTIRFDQTIVGKASWYGRPFHGRTTANGERYNMHLMTAAHKTLPFNSIVKVTNLVNGKTALVRINDRGPYIAGRNIDLSFAAAQELDMVKYGVAPVKLEIIMPDKKSSKKFAKR